MVMFATLVAATAAGSAAFLRGAASHFVTFAALAIGAAGGRGFVVLRPVFLHAGLGIFAAAAGHLAFCVLLRATGHRFLVVFRAGVVLFAAVHVLVHGGVVGHLVAARTSRLRIGRRGLLVRRGRLVRGGGLRPGHHRQGKEEDQ